MDRGTSRATHAVTALEQILAAVGRPLDAGDEVTFSGDDPILPTQFRVASAAAGAIAACGIAVSDLWHLRQSTRQAVWVQLRAAAAAMRSERYLSRTGEALPEPWDPISGFYETRDRRWMQLHCNFPHHRDGVVRFFGCQPERASVAAAVREADAAPLEEALAAAGLCAAMVRTQARWASHPQARAVNGLPLLEVKRFAESAAQALLPAQRPLSGVRVLDLTRVLAGPTCGRTLAEHGADVLRIGAAHLPSVPKLVMDTGHGKRSAYLDLDTAGARATLLNLVREADVFLQAYRPGALAARGFSPQALAERRPGIIVVELSAYGHRGPWAAKRGFDTLVQCVTGLADAQSITDRPQHLPGSVLDYTTGYLAAFGAMVALARRAEEGGSYHVRVSLCQTAHWLQQLGSLDINDSDPRRRADQTISDVADFVTESKTRFGNLVHLRPVLELSETQPYWAAPPVPLGTHEACWL